MEAREAYPHDPRAPIDLELPVTAIPGVRSGRAILAGAADMAMFWLRALAEMRGVWRYFAEILRQTAILVVGTTVILALLEFTVGGTCGLLGTYFLRSVGAQNYVGLFTSLCTIRESVPIMFGYVFAAKVGCGLVAEIGSMRINDELDAYKAVGLDPMRFVVGTRLAAAWLFMPLAFCIAAVMVYLGTDFTVVRDIGDVSQGAFASIHWELQSAADQLFSFIKLFSIGTAIVLVAAYYGYNVRGGPAEVGTATARSMIVNLVLIHVIDASWTTIFYGGSPHMPIGGGGGI
jgi:phospholipid/cholesterol/gamma-HCH transport system permease protein